MKYYATLHVFGTPQVYQFTNRDVITYLAFTDIIVIFSKRKLLSQRGEIVIVVNIYHDVLKVPGARVARWGYRACTDM